MATEMGKTQGVSAQSLQDSKKDLKIAKKQLDDLQKYKKKLEADLAKTTDAAKKAKIQEEIDYKKAAELELIAIREEAEAKEREIKAAFEKESAKRRLDDAEAVSKNITNAVGNLKTELDNTMTSFLEKQEAIAYNLNGSGKTFDGITDKLNTALNGTGIVKTQKVYENLAKLVESGISYNVEQRAYLQTLSDDLSLGFDQSSKSLNRLINLQREDMSSQRMAIQASLQTFLNQNYMTSQYIKDGFSQVSEALIEAQSLMTTNEAMKLESTVQQWLGSLSSVGMSDDTIQSLASAIGQLGSGDLSALSGSEMQNLLIMGASRANLSYADLLTNGVNQANADALMQGIVSYIASMGQNSSNVVKSAYSDIFGINVSDIVAASKVKVPTTTAEGKTNYISTDILSSLLNKTDDYIYLTRQIENGLENFKYAWATEVASDQTQYGIYKIADAVSNIAGTVLSGTTAMATPLGIGVSTNLETVIKLAPLLTTIGGLASSLGSAFGNLTTGGTKASSQYLKLFDSTDYSNIKVGGNMLGINTSSGVSQSGSMIIGNTNTSDVASSAKTSAQDLASTTISQEDEMDVDMQDIYDILNELKVVVTDLPLNPFATMTSIRTEANTVKIENDFTGIQDMITLSAMNIQNIYALLLQWSTGGSAGTANLIDTSTQEWNNKFDWVGSITSTQSAV